MLQLNRPADRRTFLTGSLLAAAGLLVPRGLTLGAGPSSPLDVPLQLIEQARARYAGVRDYTCTLSKRELVEGKLSPPTTLAMKVRTQPFCIHLRWAEPGELKGQEAVYATGKFDGKLRVRPAGLLAAVGFVLIDPNDERVRKMSHHSITEAGIGTVIERFSKGWENERALNVTEVRLGVFTFDRRRCTRVETIHASNPAGVFVHQRSVVYFDQEHHLPVRVEGYGWPTGGKPGELAEVYSFLNLKTNVGLPDAVFGI